MEEKNCCYCGKPFKKSEIKGNKHFCSYKCQYRDMNESTSDWGQHDIGYM